MGVTASRRRGSRGSGRRRAAICVDVRVPEHVVGVDDDADLTRRTARRGRAPRQRHDHRALGRPSSDAAARCPSRTPCSSGVRQQPLDALGDHLARRAQVALRSRAADEDEDVGAELRPPRRRRAGCRRVAQPWLGREEAAPAEARRREHRHRGPVGRLALRRGRPACGATARSSRSPRARAASTASASDQLVDGHLVERLRRARAVAPVGDHVPTPATGSRLRMRVAASSGSSQEARAVGEREQLGEVRRSERALSAPPTIRKCGWWPFSQARKHDARLVVERRRREDRGGPAGRSARGLLVTSSGRPRRAPAARPPRPARSRRRCRAARR